MARPPLPLGTWGKITRTELPNGTWQARTRYRDYDGTTRQVKANGPTGAAAERALTTNLRDRSTPPNIGHTEITRNTALTLLADAWIKGRSDDGSLSPQTVETYTDVIENIIKPALGGVRIREATTGLIDRHLASIESTTRRKWARVILTGMFRHAARHDAIDRNPVRETATPRATASDPRPLTLEEVQELRSNIREWQQAQESGRPRGVDLAEIVDVMLGTGLRIGEVLGLRWEDVHLSEDTSTITVEGTLVRVNGRYERQGKTKTRSSRRIIVLPTFVVEALQRQKARDLSSISNLVFPAANGNVRSPSNVRRSFRDARGTFDWVTPHTLRKTAATIVDEAHGTGAAAALLGHSATTVTERHYINRATLSPDVSGTLERLGGQTAST